MAALFYFFGGDSRYVVALGLPGERFPTLTHVGARTRLRLFSPLGPELSESDFFAHPPPPLFRWLDG